MPPKPLWFEMGEQAIHNFILLTQLESLVLVIVQDRNILNCNTCSPPLSTRFIESIYRKLQFLIPKINDAIPEIQKELKITFPVPPVKHPNICEAKDFLDTVIHKLQLVIQDKVHIILSAYRQYLNSVPPLRSILETCLVNEGTLAMSPQYIEGTVSVLARVRQANLLITDARNTSVQRLKEADEATKLESIIKFFFKLLEEYCWNPLNVKAHPYFTNQKILETYITICEHFHRDYRCNIWSYLNTSYLNYDWGKCYKMMKPTYALPQPIFFKDPELQTVAQLSQSIFMQKNPNFPIEIITLPAISANRSNNNPPDTFLSAPGSNRIF